MGVYASWNDGQSWVSLRNGLAAVPVLETVVQPRDGDLIIATHGRGLYILDDIRPLEQLADAMKGEKDVFLFDGPPAIRWQTWGRDNPLGAKEWIGQNPPLGAMIDFYSKGSAGPATIQIPRRRPASTLTMVVPVTARRESRDLGFPV